MQCPEFYMISYDLERLIFMENDSDCSNKIDHFGRPNSQYLCQILTDLNNFAWCYSSTPSALEHMIFETNEETFLQW